MIYLVGRAQFDLITKNEPGKFIFSVLASSYMDLWGVIAGRANTGTWLAVPLPLRGNLERIAVDD
ncbi:MAG: hypothetical protein FJ117_07850 [Deltaproteobacteria bacterium]|nr:hypothetical protein [Deltaproteobacteria bacterium]